MTDELKSKIKEFKDYYSFNPAIKSEISQFGAGYILTVSILNPTGYLVSSATKYVAEKNFNEDFEFLTLEAIERCL